ncbi:MAG TPA: LysR family transcriptional regulator [Dongiaceae bacterium]|jgi:DNA-binding transcriptional LysR family regulator|nr:LysR family transcriptional regulator [Dongiaceae bacterium]
MDRLDAMRLFVAASDAGSFSAAARKLKVPLPTVSRKLAQLEQHLGVRLVVRTTRKFALTEPGRSYLESCRRLLTEIEDAERMAAGEYEAPRGRLYVTAPIVFGRLHVLPVALAFLKAYPDVELRLALLDRISDLIEEGIDVALRIAHLAESSLIAARVGAVRLVTCAAPAYLKANGTPRAPSDLINHHCIASANLSATDRWAYRVEGEEQLVAIRSRLTVTTAEAAIDAAIAGIGVTRVLSYQAASAIKAGKLKLLLRPFELPEIPVSLVHPEGRLTPPKVRAFLDFAAPRLRRRLEPIQL